jgi:LysM repeat protein
MKQIIPFSRELKFNTRIYEITSISLEHSLRVSEDRDIEGSFLLSGEYRISDISVNKESFEFEIPFSIELDSKYNTDNVYIDVDDFHYDVVNDDTLKVDIDVLIDGLEEIEEKIEDKIEEKEEIMEEKEEVLEERKEGVVDGSDKERDSKVVDLFKEVDPKVVPVEVQDSNVGSIFESISEEEKFVTYHVHIVREDDTVESICTKYSVTKEELEDYNNLSELPIGTKIIVPTKNEENK